jgi:hypothetical protein
VPEEIFNDIRKLLEFVIHSGDANIAPACKVCIRSKLQKQEENKFI